jgi:NCS2 family nucleobase:cation symporter-2
MFGMVAVSGIKTLAKVNYNGNSNSLIVAVSIGAGMIPVAAPNFYHHLPQELQMFLHSGITVASILAVVMNTALNGTSSTTIAHSADTEIAAD